MAILNLSILNICPSVPMSRRSCQSAIVAPQLSQPQLSRRSCRAALVAPQLLRRKCRAAVVAPQLSRRSCRAGKSTSRSCRGAVFQPQLSPRQINNPINLINFGNDMSKFFHYISVLI